MILKFRESTISRLERLRQREKEGSDTQEDGREREIVSEKNELLSHSYLSLTFFSQMCFLVAQFIQPWMLVFPFGSNFLKRKFLSWKTKSNTIPMSQDLQWKIWNLEVRTRLLQEGFISKLFPSRRRFFRSLVFNFIQVVWSISLVWRYFSGCNQILIVKCIRSNERLTPETSASLSLDGGNFTLFNLFDTNFFVCCNLDPPWAPGKRRDPG